MISENFTCIYCGERLAVMQSKHNCKRVIKLTQEEILSDISQKERNFLMSGKVNIVTIRI